MNSTKKFFISADSQWDTRQLKTLTTIHFHVAARVSLSRNGGIARLLLDYLLLAKALGRRESGDWIVVSPTATAGLNLRRPQRIRGLKALEELGLIELRQEGKKAYRARLLYDGTQDIWEDAESAAEPPDDTSGKVTPIRGRRRRVSAQ